MSWNDSEKEIEWNWWRSPIPILPINSIHGNTGQIKEWGRDSSRRLVRKGNTRQDCWLLSALKPSSCSGLGLICSIFRFIRSWMSSCKQLPAANPIVKVIQDSCSLINRLVLWKCVPLTTDKVSWLVPLLTSLGSSFWEVVVSVSSI